VIDFPEDRAAWDVGDQFLFGPSLLVNPVTSYKARARQLYLPGRADWYDAWTGAAHAGGRAIEAPAPYDTLPLFARAGAILPLGPTSSTRVRSRRIRSRSSSTQAPTDASRSTKTTASPTSTSAAPRPASR
jgi:alpha-glucosidase (family GH31 glycosyl hydrolase)